MDLGVDMATVVENKRFYKTVIANTTEMSNRAISSGDIIYVMMAGGNAAYDTNVMVKIMVNDVLVLATHGDTQQNVLTEYIATEDGSLSIVLSNQSNSDETIGGYYEVKIQSS